MLYAILRHGKIKATLMGAAIAHMGLIRGIPAEKSRRKNIKLGDGPTVEDLSSKLDLAKQEIIRLTGMVDESNKRAEAAEKIADDARRELAFEKQTILAIARFKADRIEAAKREKQEPTSGPSFER